jgi:ABC-type Mn2+/Zn2+ transport system permease subunit
MAHQLALSLVSGVFISGSAAYLGTLMLSRKMAVVAGPLGHLALPGAALALVYEFSLSLGRVSSDLAYSALDMGEILLQRFSER